MFDILRVMGTVYCNIKSLAISVVSDQHIDDSELLFNHYSMLSNCDDHVIITAV